MKKVILVLAAAMLSVMSADAFVDNQYMTTEQYLRNVGYSGEMARMIKIVNQDPYREPYKESKNFKSIAKRAYSYLAPGTFTDIDFYDHSGSFNNPSWKDL